MYTIAIALFSASGGVNNLMTAINIAYDEQDKRNAVVKRLIALGLTLGAIVFIVLTLALVGVVPPLIESAFGGSPVIAVLLEVARWVLLVALVYVAYPFISTVPTFFNELRSANYWWALLGLAVSALTYVGAAAGLWACAGETVTFRNLVIMQFANTFAATTTPAGVGGLALSTRFLQKAGLGTVRATAAVAVSSPTLGTCIKRLAASSSLRHAASLRSISRTTPRRFSTSRSSDWAAISFVSSGSQYPLKLRGELQP